MCKLLERQQKNIEFLINETKAHYQEVGKLKVLMYAKEIKGQEWPCMTVFKGKSSKTKVHCKYKTLERMYEHFSELVKLEEEIAADMVIRKQKQQKRKEENKARIEVGTIFYTSWGYDQTNIDFYEVVAVRGYTMKLRMLAQDRTYGDYDQGKCTPVKGEYVGEEITSRINPYCKAGRYLLHFWDGREKSWTAYR